MSADLRNPQDGLFVSCVSRELHGDPGPAAPIWTDSYRAGIANFLGRCGLKAVFQEEFTQAGSGTLAMLDTYIARECKAVIHLIGKAAGASPKSDELTAFLNSHPNLLVDRPGLHTELAKSGFGSLSYTQWEAVLAINYAIKLVCLCNR